MAAVKSKETGHDRDSAGNELHRLLSSFNRKRLSPGLPTPSWRRDIDEMAALLRLEVFGGSTPGSEGKRVCSTSRSGRFHGMV